MTSEYETSKEAMIKLIEEWTHDVLDEDHKQEYETHRWLLCWAGEDNDTVFDCACCITKRTIDTCDCICHERIDSLAHFLVTRIYK